MAGHLDVAVICPPEKLSESVIVRHRFDDSFTLIVPIALQVPPNVANVGELAEWAKLAPYSRAMQQADRGRKNRWMVNFNNFFPPVRYIRGRRLYGPYSSRDD